MVPSASSGELAPQPFDAVATTVSALEAENRALRAAVVTAQRNLAESQLATLLGSWSWDVATGVLEWSDQTYRNFGVEPGAFAPSLDEYLARVHPDDRTLVMETVGRSSQNGEPFDYLHRVVWPDGSVHTHHARGFVVLGENGVPHRLFGTGQDISDRVALEEERARLVASAAAQERVAFLARITIALHDTADDAVRMTTLAHATVPVMADWCAVDLLRDDASYARVAVSRRDRVIDVTFPCEVVEAMTIGAQRAALHPLPGEEGTVVFAPLVARGTRLGTLTLVRRGRGAAHDGADLELIDELARRTALAIDGDRVVRELEEQRVEALAANDAKNRFLALMSHELRTPLNAIGGYADLLVLGVRGELTEAQRLDVERIKRAQEHLVAIITDILNFTRVAQGMVEYHMTDVSVDDTLAAISDLIVPQLEGRPVVYRSALLRGGLVVRADPERLRQILINLAQNAVKFTESGSVTVSAVRDGGMVRIDVADTGRGIAPERLRLIWEPFVQLDRTSIPGTHDGLGLGLAISRELAEGMGGRLVATSVVGEGSTFSLLLPSV